MAILVLLQAMRSRVEMSDAGLAVIDGKRRELRWNMIESVIETDVRMGRRQLFQTETLIEGRDGKGRRVTLSLPAGLRKRDADLIKAEVRKRAPPMPHRGEADSIDKM